MKKNYDGKFKSRVALETIQEMRLLSDGSYISEIHPYRQRHRGTEKIQARVIE